MSSYWRGGELLSTTIQEFSIHTPGAGPTAITAGPDGNLWFTESAANAIGMFNPVTHAISEFPLPTSHAGIADITAGSDGNLWFTEQTANQIGKINPTTHVITQYSIGNALAPSGITTGPNGKIWFVCSSGTSNIGGMTDFLGPEIGVIDPTGRTEEAISEVSARAVTLSGKLALTTGPDGNIWYAIGTDVGAVNPTTYATEFDFPVGPVVNNGSEPFFQGPQGYSITVGPDGNLWLSGAIITQVDSPTVPAPVPFVAEINASTHVVSTFTIPNDSFVSGGLPSKIVAGSDGNLWFTEPDSGRIGQINPSNHVITSFELPTSGGEPEGITSGRDGNLYFVDPVTNMIGEVRIADGPQVVSLQRFGIHAQPTTLVLTFNEPLAPANAQNPANYTIVGPHFQTIPVVWARYDPTTETVALRPKYRLNLHKTYVLTVNGTTPSGATDVRGNLLDGAKTGQPQSNFVFVTNVDRSILVLRNRARVARQR